MKIEIDETTGKVSFSINDLIAQLDDEQKIEIAKSFVWDSVIYDELKKNVLHGFAAKNYNGDIHKMRIAFLTEEGADERVRDMVKELMGELKDTKAQLQAWRDVYYRIYHGWREVVRSNNHYASFPFSAPEWKPGPPVTQTEIDELLKKLEAPQPEAE